MRGVSWILLMTLAASAGPRLVAAPASAPAAVHPVDQARDDAVQRLIDAALSLRVSDGQTVSGWLAAQPAAEIELRRALVRQAEFGPDRTTSSSIQIEARISMDSLSRTLEALPLPIAAAQRPHLVSAPGETAVQAAGRGSRDGTARDPRPGWRHCGPAEIELVRKAAGADCRQRLYAQLARMPLPGHQSLGQLARARPGFQKAVHQRLSALRLTEAQFDPAGICVVSTTLAGSQGPALLAEAARDAEETWPPEYSAMADGFLAQPLLIYGYALAPPGGRTQAVVAEGTGPQPDWADRFIKATGSAPAPVGAAANPAGRELALQAARIDALRQLWLELESLDLPGGGTSAGRLAGAEGPRIAAAIDAAVFPLASPSFNPDGTASAALSLHLHSVWQALNQGTGDR